MEQAFSRFLKWAVSISCFILGLYCLTYAMEENTIKPTMFVLLSFGVVLWMAKGVYKGSRKVMAYSGAVVVGTGVLARYAVWPLLLDNEIYIGPFLTWEASALVIGLPVMMRVFLKEK